MQARWFLNYRLKYFWPEFSTVSINQTNSNWKLRKKNWGHQPKIWWWHGPPIESPLYVGQTVNKVSTSWSSYRGTAYLEQPDARVRDDRDQMALSLHDSVLHDIINKTPFYDSYNHGCGVGFFCPAPEVHLDNFLHHTRPGP